MSYCMLSGINEVLKLYELIETVVSKSDYRILNINNKQLKINASDVDAYQKVIGVISQHNLIRHTFNTKDQRAYRLMLKNLHNFIPSKFHP